MLDQPNIVNGQPFQRPVASVSWDIRSSKTIRALRFGLWNSMRILTHIEMGTGSVCLRPTPAKRVEGGAGSTKVKLSRFRFTIRASIVDAYGSSSSNFMKRMEQAWLISQQPKPIVCTSCEEKGCVECKWCRGTGFFILGDNMLCQVPSRNTTCVICTGKGSTHCPDCKGTGFRAKWLEEPPISK